MMYFDGNPIYRLILWDENDGTKEHDPIKNKWIYDKDEDGMILMKCIHYINGNEMYMWISPAAFEAAFEIYKPAFEELEEFEDEHILNSASDEEDIL